MRLTIVTKRLGTAIAANRNPTRTMIAASTRCENGVSTGGKAASAIKSNPSGHRNQPDLPKSVMSSKNEMIQRGTWPTPRMAARIYRHHQKQIHRDD